MGQVSSTQKWCGGGLVGLVVLAILLYFLVCSSSEGLTKMDESAKMRKAVNLCADAEAGVWQEGKWHDGEVFFEEDAESEEVCAALGEEWNKIYSENKVTLLTYDHIYKICAGKKPQTQIYTAYKMITLGNCDNMEENNISTLSYNKQFDTVIANQGEFVTPNWTDITNDTAEAAATEGLGAGSTGEDQCSRGTRWLHNENLIIPGGTWMDCFERRQNLWQPVECQCSISCKEAPYGVGAFNPSPDKTENNRATIQIIKGDPEGLNSPDLSRRQNNDDYEGEDKTHLSVYLQCNMKFNAEDGYTNSGCTNDDPPRDGMTNTHYNLVEIEQNTRLCENCPIRALSDYTYLDAYENNNGRLGQIDDRNGRPAPGYEKPFDVDNFKEPDPARPNGCYVNLTYDTKFTADSPKKTGSLNYNQDPDDPFTSPATKLRPKICQATEAVTQSCEDDSEFSLLFL